MEVTILNELRDNILFIRAGGGFIADGWRRSGFRVEKPYLEAGLFVRILREIWFRAKLPFREIWYNKEIKNYTGKYLIIYDPLITRHFLDWLRKENRWEILFFYGNMVGRARHLHPDAIPADIQKWTYDPFDSRTYGLHLNKRLSYFKSFCCPKEETEYDLLFVGRDKGRVDFVCDLERKLNERGLRTFFRIVGDTRFTKHKDKRYGPEMPYEEICQLVAKSKAILNITMPGQEGLTIRDFEAICNNVKLITTNPKLKEHSFYHENNILVIDTADAEKIDAFLALPFVPYEESLLQELSLEKWLEEMVSV